MKNILLLFFLSIGCSKTDVEAEKENCRITYAELSPSKKLSFEYDAERIKTVNYFLSGDSYTINLFYDSSGGLIQSKWKYNGFDDLTENYTYSGGNISRVDYEYSDGYQGFNRLSYNSAGQLSKFTYEGNGTATYPYCTFEYNAEGSLIQTEEFDSYGLITLRKVVKPTNSVKSPESLIMEAGMPYDLVYGIPFKSVLGGDGTIIETYYPNNAGDLELYTTGLVSESKISESNYLESYLVTVSGGNSFTNNTAYTLDNCD